MTFGEADPSEQRGGAVASQTSVPGKVTFTRRELDRILGLYGRMVAAGEWRDYAIDFLKDRAVFSVASATAAPAPASAPDRASRRPFCP